MSEWLGIQWAVLAVFVGVCGLWSPRKGWAAFAMVAMAYICWP